MSAKIKDEEAGKDVIMETRAQEYERTRGRKPPMPLLLEGEHIFDAWQQLGFAHHGGMGYVPFPYTELEAFNRTHQNVYTGADLDVIRDMSSAFISGKAMGKEVDEIPPWPLRDDEGRVLDDEVNEGCETDG